MIDPTQLPESLRDRLRDFRGIREETTASPGLEGFLKVEVAPADLPVPELARLLLIRAVGSRPAWRWDKTHWVIPFRFRETRCLLAYQKFGLRLYIKKSGEGCAADDAALIIARLQKAISAFELSVLQDVAREAVDKGQVGIVNQYPRLRHRYAYFRDRAASSYSPGVSIEDGCGPQALPALLGAYDSLAMMDAYFSATEHLFVLLLPFAEFDRGSERLADFISSTWTDKYKHILGVEPGSAAKHHHDVLKGYKENLRNTFAHGGFDKNRASLYLCLPGVYRVPASLSAVRGSPHFNFSPVSELGYEEICKAFDAFDEWLWSESQPAGMRYAESGLDMPLDDEAVSEILARAADLGSFEEWLSAQSMLEDLVFNADY